MEKVEFRLCEPKNPLLKKIAAMGTTVEKTKQPEKVSPDLNDYPHGFPIINGERVAAEVKGAKKRILRGKAAFYQKWNNKAAKGDKRRCKRNFEVTS